MIEKFEQEEYSEEKNEVKKNQKEEEKIESAALYWTLLKNEFLLLRITYDNYHIFGVYRFKAMNKEDTEKAKDQWKDY